MSLVIHHVCGGLAKTTGDPSSQLFELALESVAGTAWAARLGGLQIHVGAVQAGVLWLHHGDAVSTKVQLTLNLDPQNCCGWQ